MNNRIEIKGTTDVVREQIIHVNLADLPIERDVTVVKVIVTAYSDDGRPRSRTLTIPDYMLSQVSPNNSRVTTAQF